MGYINLPSDGGVRSYETFAQFPATGVAGLIYVDEADSDLYLWTGAVYELQGGGGGGGAWGSITGTLSAQADLQAALDAKVDSPTVGVSYWTQLPSFPSSLNYTIRKIDVFGNVVATGVGELWVGVLGAGSAVTTADATNDPNAGINSTEKAFGVLKIATGTTTTGQTYVGFGGQVTNSASMIIGNQEIRYGARLSIDTISNGTENFTVYIGAMNNLVASDRGAYFRHNYNVNGGRWEFCVGNGTITAADTGVAPSATVHQVFEIVINRAATQADFYIDGALVGTVTTSLPSGGQMFANSIRKSAGTTNRVMYLDATYLAVEDLAVR